ESALGRFFAFRWTMPTPITAETDLRVARDFVAASRVDNLVGLIAAQVSRTTVDAGEPFPRCVDVRKHYGHRAILQGLNVTVQRGEVVTVMGPSGSGKSTLLRLISHLEPVDGGEITIGGEYVGYQRVDGTLRPTRHVARARAHAR